MRHVCLLIESLVSLPIKFAILPASMFRISLKTLPIRHPASYNFLRSSDGSAKEDLMRYVCANLNLGKTSF